MNKKQIRLTESDLKQIVKESVNKILHEAKDKNFRNDYQLEEFKEGLNYLALWDQTDIHTRQSCLCHSYSSTHDDVPCSVRRQCLGI